MSIHETPPPARHPSHAGSRAPLIVYGLRPAWGLPCISPFVTKVVYALRMSGVPFELRSQDPRTAQAESPSGRVPYAVDGDVRVADSNAILDHVAATRGATLDAGATHEERARIVAWTRLVDEHLYWLGVIRPRWVDHGGWAAYRQLLLGDAIEHPEARAFADAVRAHILRRFDASGLGGLTDAQLDARALQDVDALEAQLDGRPWFVGDRPRTIDATVASIVRHVVDAPYPSPAQQRMREAGTLLAHAARVTELAAKAARDAGP